MFKKLREKLKNIFGPYYWAYIVSLWIAVIFLYFSMISTSGISFILLIISILILLFNFGILINLRKK